MQAPKIPSFFKTQKIKVFDFNPRYYDKKKEKLEQLRNKRKGTKRVFLNKKTKQIGVRNRAKRLVITLIALFLLSYLLLT